MLKDIFPAVADVAGKSFTGHETSDSRK